MPATTTSPTSTAWTTGPAGGTVDVGSCAACATRPGTFRPAPPGDRASITSPEDAAGVLVDHLAGADRERCVAALLDTRHRLLGVVVVSVGSIDHTFMSPREVYRDALLANATALVLAHNHPSGDVEPSQDDEAVTRRLAAAGQLVGVELLDHLVVADGQWTSLARRGAC